MESSPGGGMQFYRVLGDLKYSPTPGGAAALLKRDSGGL